MINEANEPSSACRLWRISQVETSTPPCGTSTKWTGFGRGSRSGSGWDGSLMKQDRAGGARPSSDAASTRWRCTTDYCLPLLRAKVSSLRMTAVPPEMIEEEWIYLENLDSDQ